MKIETTGRDQQGKQSQALMEKEIFIKRICQHGKPEENILKEKSEHFALKRMKVGESLWKQEKTVNAERKETDEHSEGLDINRWVLLRKCLNNHVRITDRTTDSPFDRPTPHKALPQLPAKIREIFLQNSNQERLEPHSSAYS